jgi:membrane-bound serine protease (ClpP class)
LLLIAVEIIVVPGFGVPGVLGIAALLGGFFLAMLGRDIQTPQGIEQAALSLLAAIIVTLVGLVAVLTLLARGRRLNRLVLQATVGDAAPPAGSSSAGWLGWFGAAARLPREPRPIAQNGNTRALRRYPSLAARGEAAAGAQAAEEES